MAISRAATCIFCDDIRVEIGNKYSLMGIFSADIAFSVPGPIVLPKFGIVVWVLSDLDDVPKKIVVRVLGPPNRTELLKIEGTGDVKFAYPPDELSTTAVVRMIIPIMNFNLAEEGFVEVMVETDRETLRAGRLRVRFNVRPEEVGLPPSPSTGLVPPS